MILDALPRHTDPAYVVAVEESRRIALERIAAKQQPPQDPLSNRLAALEQRIGAIEASLGEGGEFVDAMIHGLGEVMRMLRDEIAELRQQQLKFIGVWKAGQVAEQNSLAIKDGALWLSKETTTTPPGSSNSAWTMCTKSGCVNQRGPANG